MVRWVVIAGLVGMAVVSFERTALQLERVDHPEGFYTPNEGTTTVSDEYLPRWIADKPLSRPGSKIEFVEGGGTVVPRTPAIENFDVDVTSSQDTFIQINTIYYPGWSIAVDGQATQVTHENPRGVMRVAMPAGEHRVQAAFRETPARLLSDLLSATSLLMAIMLALVRPKRYTKTKR